MRKKGNQENVGSQIKKEHHSGKWSQLCQKLLFALGNWSLDSAHASHL